MTVFALEEFKIEFDKLKKKNSYATIEKEIISYFFSDNPSQINSGVRLNNSDTVPYIKKRLNGSGGLRIYFLLIILDEKVYLMFVHPKTGSLGYDNISDKSKGWLYKKALNDIESNNLFLLTVVNDELKFDKQPPIKASSK
jgi:hypothetical protein